MAIDNHNLVDISICIPTHNRASLLKKCLSHLLTFSSVNFEIILGDNASSDNTNEVVSQFSNRFTHFTYHRHDINIGFARNMDSILRLAGGEYIYILSDDDMIFENALVLMKNILDANPTAVSVSGQYLSSEETKIGLNETYEDSQLLLFKQGDFIDLVNNFLVCDGHPFMRRSVFQQYCMYNERSFCLTPLLFKLLSHGDIVYIQKPVFQHFRNTESLTTSMTEHWFIDYVNADIEVALSGIMEHIPPDSTETMRHRMLKIIYLQAARMARLSEDYVVMWHFINRLRAINEIDDEFLTKCEVVFLLQLTINRVHRIAQDTGSNIINYEATPLINKLVEIMKPTVNNIIFKPFNSDHVSIEGQLYLLQSYDNEFISKYRLKNVIAFTDLLKSFRLTNHPIGINTDTSGIKIYFTDKTGTDILNTQSVSFDRLNSKYAD
ncbi:MAG: glycosyltransferase [Gammaproteobacteria bacterium]|nr:glycosyltransferase [Gammaproteobacteria bacterium]